MMQTDPLAIIAGPEERGRVMMVVAHPDDEVIGAGSRLGSWKDLVLVHVTDGAPRNMMDAGKIGFVRPEDYSRARRRELECALREAGASPRLVELGVADQEATVNAGSVAERLKQLFREYEPDVILTHPYEGGHPDHDGCALAVHVAAEGSVPVCEFASYHARNGAFRAGEFLPAPVEVVTIELTPDQQERKRRMIACFETQRETLAQFGVSVERYRRAPAYDFTRAPHDGTLNYERFPWGMTGARFREIAGALIGCR